MRDDPERMMIGGCGLLCLLGAGFLPAPIEVRLLFAVAGVIFLALTGAGEDRKRW